MKADGADGKEYMVEFDIFGTNDAILFTMLTPYSSK